MSLHNGIDPVAVASVGVYTSTYGSSSPANIANLYASGGLLEDAPGVLTARYLYTVIQNVIIGGLTLGHDTD